MAFVSNSGFSDVLFSTRVKKKNVVGVQQIGPRCARGILDLGASAKCSSYQFPLSRIAFSASFHVDISGEISAPAQNRSREHALPPESLNISLPLSLSSNRYIYK